MPFSDLAVLVHNYCCSSSECQVQQGNYHFKVADKTFPSKSCMQAFFLLSKCQHFFKQLSDNINATCPVSSSPITKSECCPSSECRVQKGNYQFKVSDKTFPTQSCMQVSSLFQNINIFQTIVWNINATCPVSSSIW